MKMKIHRICIVSPKYPSKEMPTQYTFVDQLACAIADEGVEVVVISPHNLLRTKSLRTKRWTKKTRQNYTIQIIQPAMLSFSSKKILGYPTGRLSEYAFSCAVDRALKKISRSIDVLYGHFLVPAGTTIAKLGMRYAITSVCAFGESDLWSVQSVGMDYARKKLLNINGIVSVSSYNKEILIDNAFANAEKIVVFPNGVDHELFFPMEQKEARYALGFPQGSVIAVYTGAFSHGKGALRVQEAALRIPELKMIYIGGGDEEPAGDNILFKGKVPHNQIPLYLSAADFFVLPTLAEGCCNAIIEAMACGLPVISANGRYNDDILNDECSIRVDPNNIDEISSAMEMLAKDKEKTRDMGRHALQASQNFDVNKRAAYIIQYMQDNVVKQKG